MTVDITELGFAVDKVRLVSYKQAWIGRDRDGNPEYRYECHWSDGSMTYAHTLPWGRMAGAIDLNTGKVEQKEMIPQS